ncbi:MAG: flagellar biosynthesis protein FlhF [Arcobacter sp.]|nr:MAG: flagellar biosynthesis protein FlhF [Arcobacter sp.]
MPRKTLKKILPNHQKIKDNKMLKIFGSLLQKKEIWSLSRKKVLAGVFIGMFIAFIPMPFQMILVTLLAIILNVNLPIPLVLIWISNPITMPFIYYFEYELGNILLNNQNAIEFSLDTMHQDLSQIASSLYVGAFVVCSFVSILSVIVLNFLWINKVKKQRKNR